MLWLRKLRLRIRSILRRETLDAQLKQEIEFHIAEQKAEYKAEGLTDREAELAARRGFGMAAMVAEQCRDERRVQWLEDFLGDAKFAARSLLRSLAFSFAALATLALGIGANVAFFSAAYAVLFRALPYPDPDRLVEIETGIGGVGPTTTLRGFATTVNFAGYLAGEATVQLTGEAVRVQTATATWNLAEALGVSPEIGRWFGPAEERAGRPRVAVISQRMWRTRLGAAPNLLGRSILVNGEPHEVVGVMPASFHFPSPLTDLWIPIRIDPANRGYMWGNMNLSPIGRLRPGVTLAAAQAELPGLLDDVRGSFPWRMPDVWGKGVTVVLHSQAMVKGAQPKLVALALGSLLLLLIACGNVANLLLTRWVRREREFNLRQALGARQGRLLRQLVTENLLLATIGAAAGVLAGWGLLKVFPLLLQDVPRVEQLSLDGRAVFTAAIATFLTFLFLTIAPMLRFQPGAAPVASGRSSTSRRSARIALTLAALQLAFATALLIGAGLMGRTLWRLANVDSGIHATQVLSASVSAGPSRCASSDRCWAFLQDLSSTLANVAGVRSVNWSNGIPLVRKTSAMAVAVEDHPKEPGSPAFVFWHTSVTAGYFRSLGIPLRAGRVFSDTDRANAQPVAIISESTSRRFWPNESPIGKRIRPVSDKIERIIVGVVADVAQYSLTGFPSWVDGAQYVPIEQALPRPAEAVELSGFIEGSGIQPAALQSALRSRFPEIVLSGATSLQAVRNASVSDRKSTALLLSLLAALGLSLGIVGVYGVLSQRAAHRTREIAIRLALGATTGRIAGAVLQEALSVALVGSIVGMSAAIVLARFLQTLLFGVVAHDPVSFLGGTAILVATALLAAAIPGLRAARVDPARSLRSE